jgi:hypothetical protein
MRREFHLSAVLLALSFPLLLSGCTMGTFARIYATSGSNISLTLLEGPTGDYGTCEHDAEQAPLIEAAIAVKDYLSRDEEKKSSELPPCESFEFHERLVFDSTGSIDLQAYFRREYGSGHDFRNVSVRLEVGFIDYILNLCTLGIANSQTVEITGDRFTRMRVRDSSGAKDE